MQLAWQDATDQAMEYTVDWVEFNSLLQNSPPDEDGVQLGDCF